MPDPKTILLLRNGSLACVENPDPDARRILEATLLYHRKELNYAGRRGRFGRPNTRSRSVPIECYNYVHDKDKLLPPRLTFAAGFINRVAKALKEAGYRVLLHRVSKHPHPEVFEPRWELLKGVKWRWGQKPAIERLIVNEFGQLQFPTGYGKSWIIRAICRLLPKAKIAITTPSLDVINNIFEQLAVDLPCVGLRTSKSHRSGSRITCYSMKSLQFCEDPVDVLLVDETHEVATDDNFRRFAHPAFHHARRWGLSANYDDRLDEVDFELEGFFGPLVARIPYEQAVAHGCIVPIEVHWRDVVSDFDPAEKYKTQISKERHGIWQHKYRNELIAEDARSFGADEQVLITVKTLDHALRLRKLLPEFEVVYSDTAFASQAGKDRLEILRINGLFRSDEVPMTWERRADCRRKFESGKLKKVIATPVWNRGVDFQRLQVLIRADAASSAIASTQIPGRTSRICLATGKKSAIVIDYCDQFNKTFRGRANTRRRHYRKHGWPQMEVNEDDVRKRMFQRSFF